MHGEVSWDHLDRLVEAYAAASLYIGEPREIESRVARAMADLLRYPGTFGDLTALLATRAPTREMVTRRVAWAAQHVLARRAWCVGSKVLVKLPGDDAGYASPLLDQLRVLGFISAGEREAGIEATDAEPAEPSADPAAPSLATRNPQLATPPNEPFEIPALDKIDALLCAPRSDEVWVVKGCSYTQAARTSPELWVNADRDSLFGTDDRFMTRLFATGSHVRTLLASRDLLQAAHPQLRVRACFMVLNDPGCSWHFQAHDLTAAMPSVAKSSRVLLDKFPVLSTHRAFGRHFAAEGLELAALPDWWTDAAESAGGLDPATALPADRPTRSLLLLQELWARQVNRPKRLATARGEDLSEAVARTSGVWLGRDQWRHDLEDCLERGGFARRLPDRPGRFAIMPKGVARLLVLKRKLSSSPAGSDITAAQLMNHVSHQARLWAAAPVA